MIEVRKVSRENALLGILLDIKYVLVPFGRIVAFVVEGSLESLAYAVVAHWVMVDGCHYFRWLNIQANRARAWRAIHGERVCWLRECVDTNVG